MRALTGGCSVLIQQRLSRANVLGLIILAFVSACTTAIPGEQSQAVDLITVQAEPQDQQAANDIAAALEANSGHICRQLRIDCQFPVLVEVYHDQDSFDQHVMDEDMRGYYAISGQGKIQTVSPEVPLPGVDTTYQDRVNISVHEYTHLALDEIQPDLPDWLDEGIAVYLAPHDLYENACRQSFPFQLVPTLTDLINAYEDIPAADLFAYTLVSYVAKEHGADVLVRLAQSGGDIQKSLGKTTSDVETGWLSYLRNTCSSASN